MKLIAPIEVAQDSSGATIPARALLQKMFAMIFLIVFWEMMSSSVNYLLVQTFVPV